MNMRSEGERMEAMGGSNFLSTREQKDVSQADMMDQSDERIPIWRDMISSIEEKQKKGEKVEDGQIGPWIHFEFLDKNGQKISATEQLSLNSFGAAFELNVFVEGKQIAKVRFQGGSKLNMLKTDVDEGYQRCGLNSRLFQHATDLFPGATEVWTKFDSTNTSTYIDGISKGMTPAEAVSKTPAGRIREKAGWVLDEEQSSLPGWDEEDGFHTYGDPNKPFNGGIRPVYKRDAGKE